MRGVVVSSILEIRSFYALSDKGLLLFVCVQVTIVLAAKNK